MNQFNDNDTPEDKKKTSLEVAPDSLMKEELFIVEHTPDSSVLSRALTGVSIYKGNIGESISAKLNSLTDNASLLYSETQSKAVSFLDLTSKWSAEIKESFTKLNIEVGEKYESFEVKSVLLKLIADIDCNLVVESIAKIKNKDPKVKVALSIVQHLILTLDAHRRSETNSKDKKRLTNELTIFKSIDLKIVISIIEPFSHLLPYGGTIIYIIRLIST